VETQEARDSHYMRTALQLAADAAAAGEVPVGAVVVSEGKIIGKGYNQVELLRDATAHAEMLAITAACHHMGAKYLPEATLYVTLEPCPMCAGALKWVQLGRLVFAAPDLRYGYRLHGNLLHPRTQLTAGIMGGQAEEMLHTFFQERRQKN
jgi:tRNA(adenine34) deaminase